MKLINFHQRIWNSNRAPLKILLTCGVAIFFIIMLYFKSNDSGINSYEKNSLEGTLNISNTTTKTSTLSFRSEDTNTSDILTMDVLSEMIGIDNITIGGKNDSFSIAVLDTGVYPHKDFTYHKNKVIAFVDLVNGIDSPYDDNGHGTAVTGIIAGNSDIPTYRGLAPFADIVSVKVLDYQCKGYRKSIMEGIQWVIDNKERYNIKMMNISIGIPADRYDDLSQLVDEAYAHGIFAVTSVGNKKNDSTELIYTPAISDSVISVGSIRETALSNSLNYHMAEFSASWNSFDNHNKPDVVAPGENIITLKSDPYYKGVGEPSEKTLYTYSSGTSLSAAVVTAFVANCIHGYPDKTVDEIKEMLYQNCIELEEAENQKFIYADGGKYE